MIAVTHNTLAQGALAVDPFELALTISIASRIVATANPAHLAAVNNRQMQNLLERQSDDIMLALRDMYETEAAERYVSVCWRLFSLYRLIGSGAVDEWMPENALADQAAIPRIIVYVAATCPLTNKKGFDAPLFNQWVRNNLANERIY